MRRTYWRRREGGKGDGTLPIEQLHGRDHEVAVRPYAVPEDGGGAVSVVALGVVVPKRDHHAHIRISSSCPWINQKGTSSDKVDDVDIARARFTTVKLTMQSRRHLRNLDRRAGVAQTRRHCGGMGRCWLVIGAGKARALNLTQLAVDRVTSSIPQTSQRIPFPTTHSGSLLRT